MPLWSVILGLLEERLSVRSSLLQVNQFYSDLSIIDLNDKEVYRKKIKVRYIGPLVVPIFSHAIRVALCAVHYFLVWWRGSADFQQISLGC
jgi:hypothetical protein